MLDRKVVKASQSGSAETEHSPLPVLRLFLFLNIVQLGLVFLFWKLSRDGVKTGKSGRDGYRAVPLDEDEEEDAEASGDDRRRRIAEVSALLADDDEEDDHPSSSPEGESTPKSRRRGMIGLGLAMATIASSWIVFGIGYASP
jgi:hypothetical protein